MKPLKPWTLLLIKLSVRDWLPMWLRRRLLKVNIWLLNRGWA